MPLVQVQRGARHNLTGNIESSLLQFDMLPAFVTKLHIGLPGARGTASDWLEGTLRIAQDESNQTSWIANVQWSKCRALPAVPFPFFSESLFKQLKRFNGSLLQREACGGEKPKKQNMLRILSWKNGCETTQSFLLLFCPKQPQKNGESQKFLQIPYLPLGWRWRLGMLIFEDVQRPVGIGADDVRGGIPLNNRKWSRIFPVGQLGKLSSFWTFWYWEGGTNRKQLGHSSRPCNFFHV